MTTKVPSFGLRQVSVLLRGEAEPIRDWMQHWDTRRACFCLVVICAGAGIYGAAMGCWRSGLQAFYVALKFPLVILLVTAGNALLNGMLAPLLGLDLRLRQSLLAILFSFTIAAVVLGAFSPLIFFFVWCLPPMSGAGQGDAVAFNVIKVLHVAIIAFSGLAANLRLAQLLRSLCGDAGVARRVLFAWLAGNLLLGSQLCWILRPFFGSPFLDVQFLRPHPLQGNFYETVFRAIRELL